MNRIITFFRGLGDVFKLIGIGLMFGFYMSLLHLSQTVRRIHYNWPPQAKIALAFLIGLIIFMIYAVFKFLF